MYFESIKKKQKNKIKVEKGKVYIFFFGSIPKLNSDNF